MVLKESFESAISSIKANALRSFLTSLAIIIGTAAVIAVIGIGNSANKALDAEIDELGVRNISIFAGQKRRGGVNSGS
ncbi:MAG: ABC transporter permease [Gammaproteobacteria bacterium]